jgi:hypothetical protein
MTENNYRSMESKYAEKVKDLEGAERRKKLAEYIWKDLNDLSERSTHLDTKDFATKLLEFLRKTWKDEKDAWNKSHPTTATPTQNGVLMPDQTVLVQSMQAMQLTQPVLTFPGSDSALVQPLSLNLVGSPLGSR